MTDRPLGRRPPTDWVHTERYPLTAPVMPDKPTPVIAGVNWYTAFDNPDLDLKGGFWIVRDGDLGTVRGGHCFCFKPDGINDPASFYRFYDQGQEGACVGFGCSRAMSLLNRRRYDAPWLYHEAQKIDEWPGEDYDGTSVRAGLDVLREQGGRQFTNRNHESEPTPAYGIAANRWASSVEDAIAAMHSPRYLKLGRMPFLNSWGKDYPHTVWMPLAVVDLLLHEDGELAVVVDR